MMKRVIAGLVLAAGTAQASQPAALVEDVDAKGAGVEFMDYVQPGQVIRLGADGTLTLSYLSSCWRETVSGGVVTVGAEQSAVAGGKVAREKVKCDAGKLQLTEQQAAKSGTMVFRRAPGPAQRPAPQITLYSTAPLIDLPGGGTLTIERLDAAAEKVVLTVPAQQLVRGKLFDGAKADVALAPGGLYRAQAGAASVVFAVDANAQSGPGPLIGRLLRLSAP